jgi:hypothetical protein
VLPDWAKVTAVFAANDRPGGTLPSPVVVASSNVAVSSRTKRCTFAPTFIGFWPSSSWNT